ncbi:MAG: flagellar assembly peptidoglycan hydrolase FlgJ [Pseudomonadota bacterium]
MLNTAIGQFLHSQSGMPQSVTVKNNEDARDVARQFEALLIHTMLKNMRAATPDGGLLSSEHGKMYMEMFDKQIAEQISHRGSFGLQESLYRQLTGQSNQATVARGTALNSTTLPAVQHLGSINSADLFARDSSPAGFVTRLQSAAAETAEKLGTTVEAVLAVAALETGWGKRVATMDNGRSTNNLFGIKSDSRWQGPSSEIQTHEYRDGQFRLEQAPFRVYLNETESVRDFGQFLSENPRYQQALSVADNPRAFITALQKAGYATDPDYAEKVISTMNSISHLLGEDNLP